MKTLLAALMLLVSLTALAQTQNRLSDYPVDPNFCGSKQSCHKGYFPLVSSGTYYARGFGRTCDEAMEDSEDRFIRAHGNMDDCGLVSGPHSWSCHRSRDGRRFVSWRECSPDSGSSSSGGSRSRCTMVFGRLVC
jgi:hypothetical protein